MVYGLWDSYAYLGVSYCKSLCDRERKWHNIVNKGCFAIWYY